MWMIGWSGSVAGAAGFDIHHTWGERVDWVWGEEYWLGAGGSIGWLLD